MKPGGKKVRKDYRYNQYPQGRGILKCEICGAPYSKHKLGPACPFAIDGELGHKPTKEKVRMDR